MDSREASAPPPPQPPPSTMAGHSPFSAVNDTNNSNPMIHNKNRFPFHPGVSSSHPPAAAPSSKPLDTLNSPPFGGSSPPPSLRTCTFSLESAASGKKKRGRPRKYSPDGNIALGLSPTPISAAAERVESDVARVPSSESQPQPSGKRQRGRPPGSGKRQLDALGSAGVGFTAHVIMIKAGEDIASKIIAFSQQGPRTFCILSANGAVFNVTLRQSTFSNGTVSYEGRFDIISISGSFSVLENEKSRTRTGGLSVSLAGSDGRVLGGEVAGVLMAATPVQVIIGSFIADKKKPSSSSSKSLTSSTPPSQMLNFGAQVAATSPPSLGAFSESSDENGDSPPNGGSGGFSNAGQPIHGMPMFSSMGWANSTVKMLPN